MGNDGSGGTTDRRGGTFRSTLRGPHRWVRWCGCEMNAAVSGNFVHNRAFQNLARRRGGDDHVVAVDCTCPAVLHWRGYRPWREIANGGRGAQMAAVASH